MNDIAANRLGTGDVPAELRTWPGWLAFFASALLLYTFTANRGPQWQDSGYHILRVVTGESVNPLGLALTHPLHHWLGRFAVAFNLVEPAFAVTLVSAFAAALAVANIYGCVIALTSDRIAAALAALSLAVANTFWQLATITETYTLAGALLSAECWCLASFLTKHSIVDRLPLPGARGFASSNHQIAKSPNHQFRSCPCAFLGMFFFNGLGLANHNFALLTMPVLAGVAIVALRHRWIAWSHVLLAAVLWLIGSLPYTGLVAAEALRSGELRTTLHSALFGNVYEKSVLNATVTGRRLLINVAFIALNFPNLLLPAAAYGLVAFRRVGVAPILRWALLAALLIHAVFVLRYSVPDQHTFFTPMYLLLVLFGGVGFAAWRSTLAPDRERDAITACRESARTHRRLVQIALLLLAVTPVLYAFVPAIARRFDVLGFVEQHKSYRDDYVYLFTPWSIVERSAERMSREAVELAGERGVIIVEDGMAEFAVRYRAIREGKKGIEITPELKPEDLLRSVAGSRPIVLVPWSVGERLTPPPSGAWRRVGDLYLLACDE